MNIKEVRKLVGSIKSSIFRNSNSYSIGMLKSHFKGSGLQFKEHQVYQHGDDVRFIDWKLLAKSNVPYVKTFEEERNVEISVFIDATPTMYYGWNRVSKLQASIEVACLLYLLAKETNDHVHLTLISDKIMTLPKLSGEKGIVALVSMLEREGIMDSDGNIDLGLSFNERIDSTTIYKEILKHIHKKREIVLLSDHFNFLDKEHMKKVKSWRSLHCFKISSPLDEQGHKKVTVFSSTNPSGTKSGFTKTSAKNSEAENLMGKNFKKINVSDRYLEQFVKEML